MALLQLTGKTYSAHRLPYEYFGKIGTRYIFDGCSGWANGA
jgi:hypothetical protein